jgi:fructan beta-fructosidase
MAATGVPLFPNSDFEQGTLANWTAAGSAFTTRQPTMGDNTRARGRESSFLQGSYWIGTFENYNGTEGAPGDTRGDGPTGTLTSQEFTIWKRYINFRIGGGNLPGQTGVKLVCEGVEHPMATGINSESMIPAGFDAGALVGKTARIVIFDQATGGWGHINVDHFEASDEPLAVEDGGFMVDPGIPLADIPPVGYEQANRPQFHFSSRRNWLNDPNGMVYDGEQYHLFFQHNPLGTGWGNMTWGHAVSSDMLHWRQMPHALLPYQVDGRYGTIYSGTAVVDHNNSLGMQVGSRKTLVAFFTYASEQPSFYQAMAYSTDGGVTWTYWNHGRAVVPNQGLDGGERDPKVFWHEASQRWVMALWVSTSPGRIRFFTSTNLHEWEFASDLLRPWAFECVDMFPLPVDGNASEQKWVIYDASFDYEIGSFDGTTFQTEAGPFHASYGNFYAAQSFNQAPDGRVVQIGWMNGGPNSADAYGLPYNQQMAFPCDLTLRTTPEGVRLCAWPIPEIGSLVNGTHQVNSQALTPTSNLLQGAGPLDLVDLAIDFDPGTASQVVFELPRTTLTYHTASGSLTFIGTDNAAHPVVDGPVSARSGHVRLRFLLDRLTVEAFAFEGEKFGTHYISPNNGAATPSIRSVGGNAFVHSLSVKSLGSAWTAETPLSGTVSNPGFEEGLPAAGAFQSSINSWQTFGGWADAAGVVNDGGNALPESAGYPPFTGAGAAMLIARDAATENSAGIYQSLGHVALADIGKTFTLGADLGARIIDGAGNYAFSGEMTVSFRKGVTGGIQGSRGTLLGLAGSRGVAADDAGLPSLASVELVRRSATFTPRMEDVGVEVFAVVDILNLSSSSSAAAGEKQYFVDRVTLGSFTPTRPEGPLAYEGFDYAAGSSNLTEGNGGSGWEGAWQTVNNGSADVVAESLAAGVNSPQDFDSRSLGNRAHLPNDRRIGRKLDTGVNGPFATAGYLDGNGRIGADGSTLYLSFLQQPNGTSYFYEFEFHRDNLGDPGRIAGIGNDRPGDNVMLRAPGNTHTLIGPGSTTVNFYVVRIDFKAGNDNVRVYRNPTTATEPASATLSLPNAADMSFNGISFGAFVNGRTVAHDEVRFGRSWQEAIGMTPYMIWATQAGLDDSPGKESGWEEDPDHDSIPNGLEWVLGGDALAGDAGGLLAAEQEDGIVMEFEVTGTALEEGILAAQWSSNLNGPWTSVPIEAGLPPNEGGVSVSVSGGASPYAVTVRIPASVATGGRIFARLGATEP